MSYDPSRKRRKRRGAVPPQLRAWVYRRRSHDPKRVSMATGYGKVRGKPYRRGARGGVAWSGGRTLRYDPQKRGWHAKARGILGKAEGFVNSWGSIIGCLSAAGVGLWSSLKSYQTQFGGNALKNYATTIFGGTLTDGQVRPPELMHLFTDPGGYLAYKLGLGTAYGTTSAWAFPFWASALGFVASKIGVLPPRVARPLGKLSLGGLIVSTVGVLALPGCASANSPNPGITSNPGIHSNPGINSTTAYTYGQ